MEQVGEGRSHSQNENFICLFSGDTLFIVMDLIEGAPLDEHFNSLKEKGNRFSEARIWNILIQVLLKFNY